MIYTTQYLSYFIDTNTPVYGGKSDTICIDKTKSISMGDTSNDHFVSFPLHIGTHIDFPYHFHPSGKKSSDYQPSFWVFEKVGCIFCDVDGIKEAIQNLPDNIEILLLKTGFSQFRGTDRYWAEQPILNSELANLFKSVFPNLRVFGFDLISLTSKLDRDEGRKAHFNFLINHDILIVEDMDLSNLQSTPSKVIISPLQISNVDGVPCNILAFNY